MRNVDRPTYTIIFRPEPKVDAIKALRSLLKNALRRHGLRCVSIREDLHLRDSSAPST